MSWKVLFLCVDFGEAVWCTTKLQGISLAMQTGDIDMFVTLLLWQTRGALASYIEIISNWSSTFTVFVCSAAAKGGFTFTGLELQHVLIEFWFWGIEWFASTNK